MGDQEYTEALKLGKKEYKSCVSQGRFPYLPVLDDILLVTFHDIIAVHIFVCNDRITDSLVDLCV